MIQILSITSTKAYYLQRIEICMMMDIKQANFRSMIQQQYDYVEGAKMIKDDNIILNINIIQFYITIKI